MTHTPRPTKPPSPGKPSVSPLGTYTLAFLGLCLTVALVLEPELAFRAAVKGLRVWWDIVFPALLPFFIGGQILMGLGAVHFMGVLMEPAMRPLFNVPGTGAFVIAMGLASGYPIGAVLSVKMRQEGLVTKVEAERLMSCANTADPLFMAGAVAVGMFANPALAGPLVAAHYLGALLTGFLLRFYRPTAPRTPPETVRDGWVIRRALRALLEARERDGRPLGQVLGDAVRDSVNTLLLIGGFIILFSVIIQMLQETGVVGFLAGLLAVPLGVLGVDPATLPGLVSGFFEITIGTQAVSQADAALLQRAMMVSAIVAWSGLSVFGQVAAIIQGSDISLRPYVFARLIHGVAAAAITVLLFDPALAEQANAMETLAGAARLADPAAPTGVPAPLAAWAGHLLAGLRAFGITLGSLGLLALALSLLTRVRRPAH